MVIFDIKNSYFEDTTVRFNYSFLDRLLSYSIFEINRAFHIGGDITIIPSFKVMYQFR